MHLLSISGASLLLAFAALDNPALAAPGHSDANAAGGSVLAKRGFGIPACSPNPPPLDGGPCKDFIQQIQRRPFEILPSTVPRVIDNSNNARPGHGCFISWTKPKNSFFSDILGSAADFCIGPNGCSTDCHMSFTSPLDSNDNEDVVRLCMGTGRACPA
ncbi:hypothetical protein RB595_005416 [Gaeumannomyces hyphopodioides]